MSYIDYTLLPNERILFRTKKHLIVFLFPVIFTVIILYASLYMRAHPLLIKLAWIPWVIMLIYWCYIGIDYLSSEFAVTNKRVMMREGFFYRHTNETRLSSISQVNVEQSLFGQIFNFGTVSINALGAFDSFPMISRPLLFQKNVNQEIDKVMSSR